MGACWGVSRALITQESNTVPDGLERERNRLKLLLDMTNTLVSNMEPRDLLHAISASIRRDMNCDVVGVFVPDSDPRQLRLRAFDFPGSSGCSKEDSLYPVEGSMLGLVFKTGTPVVVGTGAEAAKVEGELAICKLRDEGIESVCTLPLIRRNRTLGVLALGSRVENSFSPEDVDFLVRVAGQVAIAVDNALAYREIAELKDKLAQEKLYLEEEIRTAADF